MSKVENFQQRIADAIGATAIRPARTVSLPDGYNGHAMLFYAEPVVVDGDTVRLRCAEPGKDYMFAWRAARDVKAALEAQGDEVVKFDKDELHRGTIDIQRKLNERYPELKAGLLNQGFEYDSGISAFQRNGVMVYYNAGDPSIQYRLDLLMPYSRLTVKTRDTAAVVIDDRLDMELAQILDQILRTVDASREAQDLVDEAVTAPSRPRMRL